MNKLLREFLSYIVESDEPTGKSKKYDGYYKVAGFNLYSKTPGGKATHRAVGGVIEPIKKKVVSPKKKKSSSAPEQPATPKKPPTEPVPAPRPTSDPTGVKSRAQQLFKKNADPDSPVRDEVLKAVVDRFGKVNQRIGGKLDNLLDAIKNGDGERIREEVENLGLEISSTGRLKSSIHGDIFGKKDTGRKAKEIIVALLDTYNIELPTKSKKDEVPPRVKKDEFSPTKITESDEFKPADVQVIVKDGEEPRGFTIDGRQYSAVTRDKKRLVETKPINEIYVSQGMPRPEAEQKAQEADELLATHNSQIKYLATQIQKGVRFRELPEGQEGRTLLKDKLLDTMLKNSDLDDTAKKAVTDTLTKLSTAETTEEFDSAWETLKTQLVNDPTLRPAIPYLCENIEILRKATGGGRVLVPITPSFKTADVVVLGEPLEQVDVDNIEDVAKNLQLVYVQVDLRSVKSEDGGASVIGEKIQLTTFDTEERKVDLVEVCSSQSHKELWECKTPQELAAYADKKLSVLERYLPDIIAYYKLPEGTTVKEAFEILAGGSVPKYSRSGEYIGPGKPSEKFNEQMSDLNKRQLRLYSFIGFASDAIYNRGSRVQGYTNTTFKDSQIIETDGRDVMGRSMFQFNKQLKRRTDGVIRDDGFASKIRPVKREAMETYN